MHTLVCRKCGKEFQAQLISSKFCSRECAGHAAKSVLEKTCPVCGKVFVAKRNEQKFCSIACSSKNAARCGKGTIGDGTPQIKCGRLAVMKRIEKKELAARTERIRRRDNAYARWERENGVAPRFEVNGNVVTEIRGRVAAGCRSVGYVKHI